ncbi:MAG: hypothetical protein OEZ02_08120 [Anaerolineae bacterium]|nr:hypothetical protein [Anaerolineae bacterium]
MEEFYIIKPFQNMRFGRKYAYFETMAPMNYGDPEYCPVCDSPRTMRKWLQPHNIKLSSAKSESWADFVWGAGGPPFLVSRRVKDAFQAHGLTGIDNFSSPVNILKVGRNKAGDFPDSLPTYHAFDYIWNGANQDDIASNVFRYEPENKIKCDYCRAGIIPRRQDRIVLEEDSWNGSDIFIPRGSPAVFMVSTRFKLMVENLNFRNYLFIPANKYSYDDQGRDIFNKPKFSKRDYSTN